MGSIRERAKMGESLGVTVMRKARPDLGITGWQKDVRERLTFSGCLVALHLKPGGLPRPLRDKVADDLKYCRNYLLANAILQERRRKRAFDPDRILQIPYELRDRIAGIRVRPNLIVDVGEQ